MAKSFIEKFLPYNELLIDDAIFSLSPPELKNMFKSAVIQCKNGSMITNLKLTLGDSFLSENHMREKRDEVTAFLSTLNDTYEIYYTLNRTHSPFPYISMKDNMIGSAYIIEAKREDYFSEDNTLINEVYITIELKTIKSKYGVTSLIFNEYLNTIKEFITRLYTIDTYVTVLRGESTLEFLKELLTFEKHKVLLPQKGTSISSLFDTFTLKSTSVPLEIKDVENRHFVQCLTFNALPEYTYPDMLSFLYSLPFGIRVVHKFTPMTKEKSEKTISDRRRQYKSSFFSIFDHIKSEFNGNDISESADVKEGAVLGKDECDDAIRVLHQDNLVAGYYTGIIIVHSSSEEVLEKEVDEVKKLLIKDGFSVKTETLGNTLSFLTSLPGFDVPLRSLLLLSQNYVDVLHLSSPFKGAERSSLLIKRVGSTVPLLYLKNLDGSTYYFSLSGSDGEKGHTFISGPTGSGKSVFLSLLIASWQKYQNTRTVIIDRDLSSLNVVLSNDGVVNYPLGDSTAFHPLSQNRERESITFLKAVAESGRVMWNSEIESDVKNALLLLSDESDTLDDFYVLLLGINPSSPMLLALSPYVKGGTYESLFNAKTDALDSKNRITLIETNKILSLSTTTFEGVALPCMTHILQKLDEMLSESVPTLLIMDEAWKFLKNDFFRLYFEEWIKTLRKKNVDIVFSVTNLSDIVNTPIAETILSNVETRIFMSDKNAENTIEKRNYESIGLSENEIKILTLAPRFSPLILNDNSLSVVNLCVDNVLDALVTPEKMKKEFLCSDEF